MRLWWRKHRYTFQLAGYALGMLTFLAIVLAGHLVFWGLVAAVVKWVWS